MYSSKVIISSKELGRITSSSFISWPVPITKMLTPSFRSKLEGWMMLSVPEVVFPSVKRTSTLGTPNSLGLTPFLGFSNSFVQASESAKSVRMPLP